MQLCRNDCRSASRAHARTCQHSSRAFRYRRRVSSASGFEACTLAPGKLSSCWGLVLLNALAVVRSLYLGRKGVNWSTWARWDRLVPPDTQAAQRRRHLKVEAHEADQQAEGDLGRAEVPRRNGVPRHHVRRLAAGKLVQGALERRLTVLRTDSLWPRVPVHGFCR